jgi:hypothetical protein
MRTHLSALSRQAHRDHANRRLHLLLRVWRLRNRSAAEARRLLRVLFLRLAAVPADPDRTRGRINGRLLPAMKTENRANPERRDDWTRKPVSALLWWCVPLGLGFSTSLFSLTVRTAAVVWALVFAWMGAGCVLNALRCHRLHCYISGPAFFLGALAAALIAARLLGPHAIGNVVSATLAAVLLSFVPEIVWRKYA